MTIEFKRYNEINGLGNESDACETLVTEYTHCLENNICDLIIEIADNYVPVYNSELWENAKNISDYIEEAISEGGDITDLLTLFSHGYYLYYSQILYDNLDEIKFNFVAEKINHFVEGDYDSLDFDEIEEIIDMRIDSVDSNDSLELLDAIANEIIDDIVQGCFVLEE